MAQTKPKLMYGTIKVRTYHIYCARTGDFLVKGELPVGSVPEWNRKHGYIAFRFKPKTPPQPRPEYVQSKDPTTDQSVG